MKWEITNTQEERLPMNIFKDNTYQEYEGSKPIALNSWFMFAYDP